MPVHTIRYSSAYHSLYSYYNSGTQPYCIQITNHRDLLVTVQGGWHVADEMHRYCRLLRRRNTDDTGGYFARIGSHRLCPVRLLCIRRC